MQGGNLILRYHLNRRIQARHLSEGALRNAASNPRGPGAAAQTRRSGRAPTPFNRVGVNPDLRPFAPWHIIFDLPQFPGITMPRIDRIGN